MGVVFGSQFLDHLYICSSKQAEHVLICLNLLEGKKTELNPSLCVVLGHNFLSCGYFLFLKFKYSKITLYVNFSQLRFFIQRGIIYFVGSNMVVLFFRN